MVQWLGFCASTAEIPSSILGQGIKIPQAMQCGQKKEERKKRNERGDITTDPAVSKKIIRKC